MSRPFKIKNLSLTLETEELLDSKATRRVKAALTHGLKTLLKKKNRLKLKPKTRYAIHIEMISIEKMTKVNKIFRGKTGPTDVLTFARWEAKLPPLPIQDLGDILISPEVAREQAPRFHNDYHQELERLAVHGLLHLFGYDHEQGGRQEKEMFALQEAILKGLKS